MQKLILVLGIMLLAQLTFSQDSKVLLKTDYNGKVSHGSIEQLIQHIENGASIRVGWHLGSRWRPKIRFRSLGGC